MAVIANKIIIGDDVNNPILTFENVNLIQKKSTSTFIPSTYQEISYIESTGDQYIDTGVVADSFDIDFQFTADYIDSNTYSALGSRNASSAIAFGYNNGNLVSLPPNITASTYDTDRHRVKSGSYFGNRLLFDNTVIATYGTYTVVQDHTVYLFAENADGTVDKNSSCRIYSAKLYKDGVIVRNFIPVYRKTDAVVGMWDLITKTFFYNAGSESFTFDISEIKTYGMIREVSSETAVSMIGDELFIDQFTPVIDYEVWVPRIIKPVDALAIVGTDGKILCSRQNYDLRLLPYGTKITYYADDRPTGEFYCKKVERVGKTQYKINGFSAIGLLDKQYHLGDLYRGTPFSDVLYDILGDDYDYLVDGMVATQRVFGWLPYDTKRKNLHQLLVAYGVNIIKGEDGKMFFTFLEETDPAPVPSSRVMAGGSIVYDDPASRIEVTEHGYFYSEEIEEETLFDNTGGDTVINSLVTFDKPIYPDSIHVDIPEGEIYAYMTIHSCGTNYAYVSGVGILKGVPYIHTERVVAKDNSNAQVEKVVKVENATLVSALNSQQTLSRLAEYYFHATTVKEDIILDGERTGNKYEVEDPFNEQVIGFLTKMSIQTSSNRRASCDIIQNYDPVGFGASYTNSELIPLGQNARVNWVIPDSVYDNEIPSVRVVLIGHGYNGQRGMNGQDGSSSANPNNDGGAGGVAGQGGSGGRVLIITLDPTDIESLDLYNSGYDSIMEVAGMKYSSANGASRPYGYYDPFTDTTYAPRGKKGVDGGAGGMSDKYTHTSDSGSQATPGEDVIYHGTTYTGGNPSKFTMVAGRKIDPDNPGPGPMEWLHVNLHVYFGSGGGGGAAAGTNGPDVYPQQNSLTPAEADAHFWSIGEGGRGADAGPADEAINIYGAGGNGGHGGGGGGGGSNLESWNYIYTSIIAEYPRDGGKGGQGSQGGTGRYGCAIIYY